MFIYIKTHNVTGLKYLGKTRQDPYKYRGSGIKWRDHISKHGYNVTTEVIYESNNDDDIKRMGIYYSNKFNVVESKEWANLMMEEGNGGVTTLGMKHSKESRKKMSLKKRGKLNNRYGVNVSEETRHKLSYANRKACEFRGKKYNKIKDICEEYNMTRWWVCKDPTFKRL